MAPKQKTFELIPDPVGIPGQGGPGQQAGAVVSRPPMTTKQAKKLYRQKSKGPKLSKAEQRRIELMEQDRIRKEFEKEKAQARARTARERKKDKEEKEKEERRRKGLPLVEVHPSQDTISKFISRFGFGKKPAETGGKSTLSFVQEVESETATEGEPETDAGGENAQEEETDGEEASGKENHPPGDGLGDRPAKRRRLTPPTGRLLDRMIHIPSQRSAGAVARLAQELDMKSRSRGSSVDTDDVATESMVEHQLIADAELASSRSMTNSSPARECPVKDVKEASPIHILAPEAMSAAPPVLRQEPSSPSKPPHRRQDPQLPRPNVVQGTKTIVSNHVRTHVEGIFKKPASPYIPRIQEKPTIRSAAGNVPSAPPKFKTPAGPHNTRFSRPRFLPQHVQAPSRIPVQASPTYAGSRRSASESTSAVPTSTQLFVMNHADELFPSASQEAQELLEDQDPPVKPETMTKPSPSRRISQQPSVGITTATLKTGTASHEGLTSMPSEQNQVPPAAVASLDFPFLSTQDFVLSSQDMMELATPSKVQQESHFRTPKPTVEMEVLPTNHQRPSASARQCATELQAPTKSEAPALSSTTNPQPTRSSREQKSTPATGFVRGIQAQANERMVQGKENECVANQVDKSPQLECLNGSSRRRQPSQPASVATASPRECHGKVVASGQQRPGLGSQQASRHAPSSCRSLPSTIRSFRRTVLAEDKNAVNQAQACIVPPRPSPPKKRMFGSSGPGAEVLVAMERSFQQSRLEERRREEELRAQARIVQANRQRETEQLAMELADIIDDDDDGDVLSDGWISEDITDPAPSPPNHIGIGTTGDSHQTSSAKPDAKAGPPASQETDYGDFDFEVGEELGLLTDMTWVDDDLDGF